MTDEKQHLDEAEEYELDLEAEYDTDAAVRSASDAVEAAGARQHESPEDAPVAPDELPNPEDAESDLQERLLRTLAEYENFRKRVRRERIEERRFAGFGLLLEFLQVVDNLERALRSGGSVEELKTGVEMILRQMYDLMDRAGVSKVVALDQPFDPAVHEAVAREEADVEIPVVIEEHQPGYQMHERLLRPATVTVAVPHEREAISEAESATEDS